MDICKKEIVMDICKGEGGSKKDWKYLNVLHAVVGLEHARMTVQKLCNEMCGIKEVPAPDKKPDGPPGPGEIPCLLEVLESVPKTIDHECELIKDAVREIRAQIL